MAQVIDRQLKLQFWKHQGLSKLMKNLCLFVGREGVTALLNGFKCQTCAQS